MGGGGGNIKTPEDYREIRMQNWAKIPPLPLAKPKL